jgi:hypothetical protein
MWRHRIPWNAIATQNQSRWRAVPGSGRIVSRMSGRSGVSSPLTSSSHV